MAGGYTHITVAQLGIRQAVYQAGLLHDDARLGLSFFKTHCIVGAISPDYPYMHLNHADSAAWADAMHKGKAVDLLRVMAARVAAMSDEAVRHKCLAWLFGFASHLVTDGVVHPIVNLKVGVYEDNKVCHRRCEMSQDVFINPRLGLGPLENNQQITRSVKALTDEVEGRKGLDRDIDALWRGALKVVYPGHPEPDVGGWHEGMWNVMEVWQHGGLLFFARDTAARHALVYPAQADPRFIENLEAPCGEPLHFDAVADMAIARTLEMWGWLSLTLQGKASPLDSLVSWSLDTGIDETGKMVFGPGPNPRVPSPGVKCCD